MSKAFEVDRSLGLEEVDVHRGYEIWASSYDEMLTDTVDGVILERFLNSLPSTELLVLDVGCGTGRNIEWLRNAGLQLRAVGLDSSPAMLQRARAKGIYDEIIECDLDQGFAWQRKFDLVLSVAVSSHLKDSRSLFEVARRNVVTSGQFWLVDMHPHMFHMGKGTFVPLNGKEVYIRNYVHEVTDYLNTAVNTGFELLETQESYVPCDWGSKSSTYREVIGHPLGIGFRWGVGQK